MHIPATLMRGGSSKCWLFDRDDMPTDRHELSELLIELFGADDPHQLDGVGGGTSVTSKAAVIARSAEPGIDIEYLFAQVAVGEHVVEWGSNCGNCATGVALWAADRYDLPADGDGSRLVRMRNLNTGALVQSRVAAPGNPEVGVPGVRGRGTAVDLSFIDPSGSTTGVLFPAGAASTTLQLGDRNVVASLVDAGAPVALVTADTFGLGDAPDTADVIGVLQQLRDLRSHAAVAMGIAASAAEAFDAVPKVGVVGNAVAYRTTLGDIVAADEYDVSVRMLSMNAPHPTIGLTTAVALAVAAFSGGSVLEAAGVRAGTRVLRIGTLGGVLRCAIETDGDRVDVALQRAARRLAESSLIARQRAA